MPPNYVAGHAGHLEILGENIIQIWPRGEPLDHWSTQSKTPKTRTYLYNSLYFPLVFAFVLYLYLYWLVVWNISILSILIVYDQPMVCYFFPQKLAQPPTSCTFSHHDSVVPRSSRPWFSELSRTGLAGRAPTWTSVNLWSARWTSGTPSASQPRRPGDRNAHLLVIDWGYYPWDHVTFIIYRFIECLYVIFTLHGGIMFHL